MRLAFAAAAGALIPGLVMVLLGIGWSGVEPYMRERLFLVALNAVFLGWLLALPVRLLSRDAAPRQSRAFFTGAAAGLAPLGWFAAGFAVVSVIAAWRRTPAVPWRPLFAFGLLAHLLPVATYLVPPSTAPSPLANPGPPLPGWTPLAAAPADADADGDNGDAGDAPAPVPVPDGPDVLVVVVDTLRADAVLDPRIPTPHLDALRAGGLWAPAAVAPCNQTLPSHLALLTGLHIEKLGMRSNLSRWPTGEKLRSEWSMTPLAERFRAAGYRTAAVVSNPLLSDVDTGAGHQGFEDGFEAWNGMQRHNYWREFREWYCSHTLFGMALPRQWTGFPLSRLLLPTGIRQFRHHFDEGRRTTEQALPWLTELQQGERPYFFLLHYMDPHSPYVPPAPSKGTLATADARPDGFADTPEAELDMRVHLLDGIHARVKAARAGAAAAADAMPADADAVAGFLHELYREEVAEVDRQLGRVLEAVRASGRPTVVLFTSDHGEQFLEHGWTEHSHTLYDEEVLVPFIVAGPGVPQGVELGYAPELVDAGPTLLALTGVAAAEAARGVVPPDGRDLVAAAAVAPERPNFAVMTDHVVVRGPRVKLHARVRYPLDEKTGKVLRDELEVAALHLYDVVADPGETRDLLAEQPADAEPLLAALRDWLEQDYYPELPPRVFSASTRNNLAQLGYAGMDDSH